MGTPELGRHATSVASLPRASAIRRWGTTHRSNRREVLLVGALGGTSFGLHHLKSSRLSPAGLRAGGLPLFAVSFLFPFSGPFQRVERFVIGTEVPLAHTRDVFRCRQMPSSGRTRIVLARWTKGVRLDGFFHPAAVTRLAEAPHRRFCGPCHAGANFQQDLAESNT